MTAFSRIFRLAKLACLALALILAGTFAQFAPSPALATDTYSGASSRSGVVFRKHKHRHHYSHHRSVSRAGVTGHRFHKGNRKHLHKRINVRRDLQLNERRRQIAERNRVIAEQELIEKQIRRGGVQVVPSTGFVGTTTIGGGVILNGTGGSPCPDGLNCGYRLYEDGTGPRIIVLGEEGAGIDQPYDGLNGPKIIRLD
ncbi:MAG: hypothetical protein AAFN43_11610 [Pseudomonadota bacterium]